MAPFAVIFSQNQFVPFMLKMYNLQFISFLLSLSCQKNNLVKKQKFSQDFEQYVNSLPLTIFLWLLVCS